MPDYLFNVIGAPMDQINWAYATTAFTAPTLGAIMSGYAVNSVGGYNSKRALPLCLTLSITAIFISIPIAF